MQPTKSPASVAPFLFAGLAFGVGMGVFYAWSTGNALYGVRMGVLCGIGFGLMTLLFVKVVTGSSRLDAGGEGGFDADETIVHAGLANHFKGAESVGGKLFLTNKRLRFRSHKFNLRTHDESYPVAAIASVEPSRTLGIVPNGVLVHLRDGRRERFVVSGRAEWVARIEAASRGAG